MTNHKLLIAIPREQIPNLFTHRRLVFVHQGIPRDAKCVSVGFNEENDSLYMIFEHPSFKETTEGCPILRRCPIFTTVDLYEEEILT